jgi:hypothetical protein
MKVRAISNFDYEGGHYTQDQILEVTEEQAQFLSGVNAVVILEDDGEPLDDQSKLEEEDETAPLVDPAVTVPTQPPAPEATPSVPTPEGTTEEQVAAVLAATEASSTQPPVEPVV